MNHTDVLAEAVRVLRERDRKYGNVEEMFERTARLASIVLDEDISPYKIAIILKCLKDARKKNDPYNVEHYSDAINYEAFAYQFKTAALDQAADNAVTAELARKLAPELPNVEDYNG
jgi:hypothetical protein